MRSAVRPFAVTSADHCDSPAEGRARGAGERSQPPIMAERLQDTSGSADRTGRNGPTGLRSRARARRMCNRPPPARPASEKTGCAESSALVCVASSSARIRRASSARPGLASLFAPPPGLRILGRFSGLPLARSSTTACGPNEEHAGCVSRLRNPEAGRSCRAWVLRCGASTTRRNGAWQTRGQNQTSSNVRSAPRDARR